MATILESFLCCLRLPTSNKHTLTSHQFNIPAFDIPHFKPVLGILAFQAALTLPW